MRSTNDPIRRLQRRTRLTWFIGGLAVVIFSIWSLQPLHQSMVDPGVQQVNPTKPAATEPSQHDESIDPRVFAVNLWNPPPQPPAPEIQATAPPESAKPLNLQLVGIIHDSGEYKAALYDIDGDRLLIVGDGDKVQQQTVKVVTHRTIELIDGTSVRTLTLDTPAPGPGSGVPTPSAIPTPASAPVSSGMSDEIGAVGSSS